MGVGDYFIEAGWGNSIEKVTFQQRAQGNEGGSHAGIWANRVPRRGKKQEQKPEPEVAWYIPEHHERSAPRAE